MRPPEDRSASPQLPVVFRSRLLAIGRALVVPALLLACFGRLVAHPSGLLVDPDRPAVDYNERSFEPPTVGNDAIRLFIPHHAAIARHLARLGRVPAWDDRGFGGRPLVGNPQAGTSYPPIWLAWRVWTPSLLGWMTLAHLLFAALGTYLLARRLGIGVWASWVAAGCFSMSPYVLAQAFEGHLPHVWGASWSPWAFWLAIGARRGEPRSGLLLAVALALALLAGHPQEPVLLVLTLAMWEAATLARLAATRRVRLADLARRGGAGCILLLLTLGLTATDWLPAACVSPWTLRSEPLSVAVAGRYHLFPSNLVQLLSPLALGGPSDYLGHDNYWEPLLAMGLIPLGLALIAVFHSHKEGAVRDWLALTLGAVWFAAGRQLGLFSLLHHMIPGLDRFRVPTRSLFLASLGASVLAGLGVDSLRRLAGNPGDWAVWSRHLRRILVAVAASVSIALIASPGQWTQPTPGRSPGEAARIVQGLARVGVEPVFWMALGSFWAVAEVGRRAQIRPSLAGFLGLAGLIELAAYGHGLLKLAPADQFLGPDPMTRAIAADRPPGSLPARIRAVDSWFDDLRAQAHGLQKTNLNDSFQIRHAARVYEPLYRTFAPDPSLRDRPLDAAVAEFRRVERQAILDQLGVEYLLANRRPPDSNWPLLAHGAWNGSPYFVARNPTTLPRARVVAPSDPGDSMHGGQPVIWLGNEPDRIHLRITSAGQQSLILAETWMPGWTARVDGNSVGVSRGAFAQCLIPIEGAGTHEVVIEYQPPGLVPSQAIATIATLTWITLFGLAWSMRQGGTPGDNDTNPDKSGRGR